MKIAIIGLGPAGIFALALMPDAVLKDVVVFEPAAIGGDLATKYAAVVANIPKSAIIAALRSVPRWESTVFPFLDSYADDVCPPLGVVAKQLRTLVTPLLREIVFQASKVIQITANSANYTIKTSTNQLFEVQKIIVCTGAEPRSMNLPLPTIPLHVALTPALLCAHVGSHDSVVVFGTAHSGTLVLKNLKEAGVHNITAVYKGTTPFVYARDGESEGIKQESAAIADEIKAGTWASQTPALLSYGDFATVYRAVHASTAVVYACGFNKGVLELQHTDGTTVQYAHDGSRFINGPPGVFGFGLGFPSLYTGNDGKQYPDIGFGGFIAAIKSELTAILQPVAAVPELPLATAQ